MQKVHFYLYKGEQSAVLFEVLILMEQVASLTKSQGCLKLITFHRTDMTKNAFAVSIKKSVPQNQAHVQNDFNLTVASK